MFSKKVDGNKWLFAGSGGRSKKHTGHIPRLVLLVQQIIFVNCCVVAVVVILSSES